MDTLYWRTLSPRETRATRINRTLDGGGDYYVRVYTSTSTTGTAYALALNAQRIKPADNGPDTLATARDLGIVTALREVRDWVGSVDPHDYYKFALADTAANWTLTTTLTGMSDNGNVQLLDRNGNVIWDGDKSGATEESDTRVLAADTYYIHVYSASGSENTAYVLKWDAQPVDPVANLKTIPEAVVFTPEVKEFIERVTGQSWSTVTSVATDRYDLPADNRMQVGFSFGFYAGASLGTFISYDIADARLAYTVTRDVSAQEWKVSRGFVLSFAGLETVGDEYLIIPDDISKNIRAGIEWVRPGDGVNFLKANGGPNFAWEEVIQVKVKLEATLGVQLITQFETQLPRETFLCTHRTVHGRRGHLDSFGFAASTFAETVAHIHVIPVAGWPRVCCGV